MEALLPGSEVSYLELQAMRNEALGRYLHSLGLFCGPTPLSSAMVENAKDVDESMVTWVNSNFRKGSRPWLGEKALAAYWHWRPALGRRGTFRSRVRHAA